jgi:hypothetical protein
MPFSPCFARVWDLGEYIDQRRDTNRALGQQIVYLGQLALFQSGFIHQDHFSHLLPFIVRQVYLILENDKALADRTIPFLLGASMI